MTSDTVTDFSPSRIAVIGAGPVGCVVSASLANAGHEVILCDMVQDLLAPAMDPGIRVEGSIEIGGRVAHTVTSLDALANDPPELIFITTKATALPLIASAMETFHRPGNLRGELAKWTGYRAGFGRAPG